ncbi:hypothetical protein C8Q74DRAFT_379858 [Fomes fomentarius]|nr:hypothetical protein C8Q74DRAFT_379858 [Fomes fomentarius]
MFNRTANFAHGTRSLAPVFKLSKLKPKQRVRLEKSSQKVGDLPGGMPIIDIVPASPKADGMSVVSQVVEEKRGKKGANAAPAAPILRFNLTALNSEPRPTTPVPMGGLQVPGARPRKTVPNSLDLASPVWRRTDAMPLSPLRHNRAGFLSPVSPLSPFSPIETTDMRQDRYYGLRRLASVSRAFRETIVDELPSIAQTVEDADNVNTYLDLYRIATKSKRLTRDSDAYTAYSPCIEPQSAYTACSFTSRRRSVSFSHMQRRSIYTARSATPTARTSFIVPHSVTPSARTSFIVPYSATVFSAAVRPEHHSVLIDIPTPVRNAIVEPRTAGSHRMSSMSYTLVLNVPPKRSGFPETPADEDSPLQQQQKAARSRAAIIAAMRPLEIPLGTEPDFTPSPITPLPTSQPKTPGLHAPYWVRSSYRVSAHGYVRRTHSYSRRSGMRVPPTPRTIRKERRQGWGGQWTQGKIATAVEGLKEIQTPAPPVPEKDSVVVNAA